MDHLQGDDDAEAPPVGTVDESIAEEHMPTTGTDGESPSDCDSSDAEDSSTSSGEGAGQDDGETNDQNSSTMTPNCSALLGWLRTFPVLEDHLDADDGTVGCNFGNREVVAALLEAVKELYGHEDEDDTDEELSADSDVDSMWKHIMAITNGAIDEEDIVAIVQGSSDDNAMSTVESFLTALLCQAVSAECPLQKTYIGRIMGMDSAEQMSLMKIISDVNNANAAASNHTDGEEDDDDDGSVGAASIASVASVMESILSGRNGGRIMSPLKSGYTPAKKRSKAIAEEDGCDETENDHDDATTPVTSTKKMGQCPMSAVKMHRGANDEVFSPVGSVFSPAATANDNADDDNDDDDSTANGGNSSAMKSRTSYDHSATTSTAATEEIQDLKGKLEFVGKELEVARQREADLGSQLEDIESKHRAEKMKIEADSIAREKDITDQYSEELTALRREVEELRHCRKDAADAREELDALRDEMDVLNHTKERLASTEEQFRKCREKLEQMGDAKEALTRAEEAHGAAIARGLELENELKSLQPLRRQLEDYKTRAVDAEVKLAECQEELQNLQKLSSELTGMNKELKQGVMIHQSETEGLRRRLMEDTESSGGAKGPAVGEGLSELNPALMAEMESLRNENARLKAFAAQREDDSVQKLEESLDDNQRLAQRYKEQFLATKNELSEAQQALRDSMLREEQLKLEIASLNNDVSNLQNELKDEKLAHQKALVDAERTLQETKQGLIDKAREDMEDLETKMNSLLEEEQTRCKEALEKAEEEKRSIEEQSSNALSELEESTSAALKSAQEESEQRIADLEKEHASAMEEAAAQAKEEREKLVAKGKNMIRDVKAKAAEEMAAKEESHIAEKDEIRQMCAQFTEEQQEYEEKARAKITQYKQKLQVASGRQAELIQEAEELQDRIKKLEREKMTLTGDNDRYRRMLGSRYGSDSGTQMQFETLQQEFNAMLEENKGLKKKLAQGGGAPFDFDFSHSSDAMSSSRQYGATKDTSTISALRAEYEDTIQTLQDEKRELVMKNSSYLSDVQKSDQRSWELEEELNKVKQALTTTKLALQRMERNQAIGGASSANMSMSMDATNMSVHSVQSFHTARSPDTKDIGGSSAGEKEEDPVDDEVEKENAQNLTIESSADARHEKKKPRSLIDATQPGSEIEGKPECQQS